MRELEAREGAGYRRGDGVKRAFEVFAIARSESDEVIQSFLDRVAFACDDG